MKDWRVSVIVPVHCGEQFIEHALSSILRQNAPVHEIIVIDDGSTDNTAAIVQGFSEPVRYLYQDNKGPQHARNRGLTLAEGNVIAFLDADDAWRANKLTLQLPMLDQFAVVMGHTKIMDDPDALPFILPSLCCALIRKSAFDEIGSFDPQLECSDDMDWYLRAREAGMPITLHEDVVLEHRRHDRNLTRDVVKKEHFHLLMLRKSIERRRASGGTDMPQFSDFLTQSQR